MASFFNLRGTVADSDQRAATSPTLIDSANAVAINKEGMFELVPMTDQIDSALYQHVPPNHRPKRLDPLDYLRNTLPQLADLDGLVKSCSWRALALASRSIIVRLPLSQYGEILETWTYRCLSLIRLDYPDLALREMRRLEIASQHPMADDATLDLGREVHHPMSAWPWELRVMRAQLPTILATSPRYNGTTSDRYRLIGSSITRSHALLRSLIRRIRALDDTAVNSPQRCMYRTRHIQLVFLLARLLLCLRDVPQAIHLIQDQIDGVDANPLLLAVLARLHLQYGDVRCATDIIQKLASLLPGEGDYDDLATMSQAFLAVAQGRWEEAKERFAAVSQRHPSSPAASNNIAVCNTYIGDLSMALDELDRSFTMSLSAQSEAADAKALGPAQIPETLVYNYCTLLELQLDDYKLQQAKTQKLVQIAESVGDGFDVRSLKL
ncbi:hypothetical protein EV182_001829 [Spiromyces aspiralis]|uniref:Uncharacterized protein n=1 Tax=Spiromyces aspiralis TaxID=68401 RepID=A0ACC1HLH7_9FUNG|nr:hypothetical protein EV182_001829 [Spiromyces aspiralis]